MNYLLSFLRRYFNPEEIIAIPFIILLSISFYLYDLPFRLRPGLAYWIEFAAFGYLFIFITLLIFKIFIMKKGVKKSQVSVFFQSLFSFFRVWIPLVVIFIVYENLHDLIPLIGLTDKDSLLLSIDTLLFGSVHVTILLEKFVNPLLTEWMHFSYLSLYFYIPILAGIFYFTNRRHAWQHFILSLTLVAFIGFIGYFFVPAVGPLYFIADQYSIDLQGIVISSPAFELHESLRISRDVFPSLHIAFSALYLLIAWRYFRPCFYLFLPFIVSLWFSTVYLRYHYVIDVIVGFALAIFSFVVSIYIHKWWYKETTPLSKRNFKKTVFLGHS